MAITKPRYEYHRNRLGENYVSITSWPTLEHSSASATGTAVLGHVKPTLPSPTLWHATSPHCYPTPTTWLCHKVLISYHIFCCVATKWSHLYAYHAYSGTFKLACHGQALWRNHFQLVDFRHQHYLSWSLCGLSVSQISRMCTWNKFETMFLFRCMFSLLAFFLRNAGLLMVCW